ncbi:MAG: hypothetical protein PVI51_01090 [candidate division WOR-3 bacterium]|jgi:hypothetical protein
MMILLLLLLSSQPAEIESWALGRRFNRMECQDNDLFLAPRIGQSITQRITADSLRLITVTDQINYRIYDFRMAPFAIYINRGSALDKFFTNSGQRETIYASRNISSFDLTPDDEIVLSDRQTRELIFLDFAYEVKFKIENIGIEDIQWHDTLIYALAATRIHIYDEHGNLIEQRAIPESSNRMVVGDDMILIFTEQNKHLYRAGAEWRRIEFPYAISDICIKNNSVLILDGSRNYLHSYNRDDF